MNFYYFVVREALNWNTNRPLSSGFKLAFKSAGGPQGGISIARPQTQD